MLFRAPELAPSSILEYPSPPQQQHLHIMPDISNSAENTAPEPVIASGPASSSAPTTTTAVSPHPQRPLSQASMSSPVFVNSRPASPSSPHGRPPYPHIRRSSSSLSTSSRGRPLLLTPQDPTLPQRLPRTGPADATAFAELHQELEAEQEAQVNRLLNMIRIQSLQAGSVDGDAVSNAATVDSASTHAGRPHSPISRRGSNRVSRDGSYYHPRSISRTSSPGLTAGNDSAASETSGWAASSHEKSFYAAESQMLKRENEMLKRRIRELEKIVTDMSGKSAPETTVPSSTSEPGSEVADPHAA